MLCMTGVVKKKSAYLFSRLMSIGSTPQNKDIKHLKAVQCSAG